MKLKNIFFGHNYTKFRFLLFLLAIQIYIIKDPNFSISKENFLVKKRLRPFSDLVNKNLKKKTQYLFLNQINFIMNAYLATLNIL